MNFAISPITSNTNVSNLSFGMAKFTKEGLHRAKEAGGDYEPLQNPNTYYPPKFFSKKKLFRKAPFAVTLKEELPLKKPVSEKKVEKISSIINDCGTTKFSFVNAKFIKQLLTTEDYINKLDEEVQVPIRESISKVLETNWNNPQITDEETRTLARMSVGAITKKQELILNGALDKALE